MLLLPKPKPPHPTPPPPKGSKSWLNYAVASFSGREAQQHHLFDERFEEVPAQFYKELIASQYQALKAGQAPGRQPKRIYLVRHAQCVADATEEPVSSEDSPLTELGSQQAEGLASLLPPDPSAILISNQLQVEQSVLPYARLVNREAQTFSALNEFALLDPNLAKNTSYAARHELVERYWASADADLRTGAGAESFWAFEQRVNDCKGLMEFEFLPHGSVVVGHATWMALLCWKLMGFSGSDDLAVFRRFQMGLPMPNGAIYELTRSSADRWSVHFFQPPPDMQRGIRKHYRRTSALGFTKRLP